MRLTLCTLAVALLLAVGATALSAQYPYSGYANSPYSVGPYQGGGMYCAKFQILQGSTVLLTNSSGAAGSPYNTYYGGSVSPANIVPTTTYTAAVTIGGSYTTYAAVFIDYGNNGTFTDSGDLACYSTTGTYNNGVLNMTFTTPSVGGVKRLRVRTNYYAIANSPTATYSYGEAEDYLVNLGFAITTNSPMAAGAVSAGYAEDINATNGSAPYTWQYSSQGYIKAGSLPAGLSASPTGSPAHLHIAGTPTTAGTSTFTVEVHDNAGKIAIKQFQITIFPPPASLPFSDEFSTDKGWQLNGQWQRGSATYYSATGPNREEPANDHSSSSDNMIMGHNIGHDYANSMSTTDWAVSPPVDCSSSSPAYVRLRFWSYSGFSPGDEAEIDCSNNGGVTWTQVWAKASGNTYQDQQWTSFAVDLSAVAVGKAVVQIRFGVGPTDSSIPNTGWCIDDLKIEEPGYDMKVTEVSPTGTQIYDNDAVGGARDFGQIGTKTQSNPLDIYITNLGPTPIAFTKFTKTGNDPLDFTINYSVINQQNPLGVGDTTSIRIIFYRSTVGVSTCTLEMEHNAKYSGTSPFQINFKGEAINPQPIIQVNMGSATGSQISHQQSPTNTPRDFGNQDINAGPTAPITIFVTNTGTGTLSLNAPFRQGTWWSEYQVNTAGFSNSLTPGQSTSFEVTFDPTSVGQKDAEIWIQHTDTTQTSPFVIPVTGNGTSSNGATLKVHEGQQTGPVINHNDPASGGRDFGSVVVGNTSAPLTITIENAGGASMNLSIPALGGTNPGEFTINTGVFQTAVSPGGTTSFEVAFAPTSVGVKLAQVTFTHNDTNVTSPFIINLKGNGVTVAPVIEVRETDQNGTVLTNPAAATGILDFGNQDVNSGPTSPATIYVANTGSANLTLGTPSFVSATTEFQLQTTGFAGSIAPGSSATFDITFDPTAAGTQTAQVQFTHNDSSAGSPFILNVTGNGVLNAPVIEVRESSTIGTKLASGDPAPGTARDLGSIDVSSGNTLPVTIYILNTGNQTLNVGTPTLTGTNAADFILNTAGMTSAVTPGGNTSFDVLFDPVLAGMKDAQVEFSQDDPGSPDPFVVKVVGTGTDPNAVQITTPNLPGAIPDQQYGPVGMNAIQGTTPYTWSIYSGSLPPGLNLSSTGVISGKAAGFGGNYQVTIRVADASGATNEKTYAVILSGDLSGRGKATSSCSVDDSGTGLALLAALGLLLCGFRVVRRRA